jgi:hypothetical protein
MSDKFRKLLDTRTGLGGVKCYCCKIYKGKERKKLNRIVRHQIKREDYKNC